MLPVYRKAAALKLAELGASVTIVDITEEGGEDTAQLIEEKEGSAIFVKANVTSPSDVQNYVDQTIEKFGRVDLFFNNAGIVGKTGNLAEQQSDERSRYITGTVIPIDGGYTA